MMRKLIPMNLKKPQPSLDDVLTKIAQANDLEISEIIQAVIRRYSRVFPDWEVVFLSLPLQPDERKKLLEQTIAQLRKL